MESKLKRKIENKEDRNWGEKLEERKRNKKRRFCYLTE